MVTTGIRIPHSSPSLSDEGYLYLTVVKAHKRTKVTDLGSASQRLLAAKTSKDYINISTFINFQRDSLEDDPRQGRPATVTSQEIIDKIHDKFLIDRRLTERFTATELGISQERFHAIIHNHLEMRKVSTRWVPKFLGPDQKCLRCSMSKNNLTIFDADLQRFISRFVTIDETWVHHFQPESKEQSKQWKHHGFPAPKRAKSVISAGKAAARAKLGKTAWKAVFRGAFHQDNAPPHKSTVALAAIRNCGFQIVDYPPDSPDLAP
ncbi:histone-lysine N-methyltransferase SETMAR-like [Oratosquilla oratoria]|uniref:histone-lysine N-methyltransferase SETMAR-like n=1 Tax=Oratosquilla oratoria TaxID=337810 RepID=UPI003F75A3EF